MRLLQFLRADGQRAVGQVEAPDTVRVLTGCDSTYALVQQALAEQTPLARLAKKRVSGERVAYDELVERQAVLVPLDHPDPAHMLVSITGLSRIVREGRMRWEKPFLTGEENMSHSIANIEFHHFKYDQFLVPGDVHVHYFGTATLSFAEGIKVDTSCRFEISAPPFGRALVNGLRRVSNAFRYGSMKAA